MKSPPAKLYSDKFAGQVAVVTGAAQGIGEVTAKTFAAQGAKVVLVDLQKEKLQSVMAEIKSKTGAEVVYRQVDVSDETHVKSLVDEVIRIYGQVHILVHLAGVYPSAPEFLGTTTEEYRKVMGVNMDSTYFLVREFLPHMNERNYGRIICTSSGTFQTPIKGSAIYVAAKAAIIGFMRAVAVEAQVGVTANTIMPGLIASAKVKAQYTLPDGTSPFFDNILEKQAIKRTGLPEDIAYTISFIASPESSFTSGQIFDVGGGATFH